MKRFKKLFLMCAAVSAVAAVSCTAAMAANDFTATYDADAGTVTIGEYTSTGTQQTLVVLDEDCETVTEECIVQIQQQGEAYTTVPVGTLEDGTYYVRIGGDSATTFLQSSFKVGAASTQLLGDVDNNAIINGTDATKVTNYVLKTETLEGDNLLAADADDNAIVNGTDATQIANYVLKNDSTVDGVKTVSDKTNQDVK